MKISLKPAHLKRYKDIVALFWKYGRSDIALDLGDDEVLDQQEKIDDGKRPKLRYWRSRPLPVRMPPCG